MNKGGIHCYWSKNQFFENMYLLPNSMSLGHDYWSKNQFFKNMSHMSNGMYPGGQSAQGTL